MITIFCQEERTLSQIKSVLDELKIQYIQGSNIVSVANGITNIGICDSCDKTALVYFRNKNIPVITCGMGAKNTLTLSSFKGGMALITVQRKLPFESENDEKPEEFSLSFKDDLAPFTVMATFAVSRLTDNESSRDLEREL